MQNLKDIVTCYQNKLKETYDVCRGSFNRSTIGKDGQPNRKFFTILFTDKEMSIQFLQEVGLLKTCAICKKCGKEMAFNIKREAWYCWKQRCGSRITLKCQSLFNRCNLTYEEVIHLLYEILKNTSGDDIKEEYNFDDHTLCNWRSLVRAVLIFNAEMSSKKIGGPGTIVEIDESKFGKQKYYKGHYVQGQWVFIGVERGTGQCFLVPVEDRSEETLITVIETWIKPGTTIVSHCWKSYNALSENCLDHLKVNHSIEFAKEISGPTTNAIESTWRNVKATLPQTQRRKSEFTDHLATYIFNKECKLKGESRIVKFIHIASTIQWD